MCRTGAAWGVFLRNHDELTLEMVSEEYRQAMYGWYAYDPRMRSNIGIRRRLGPCSTTPAPSSSWRTRCCSRCPGSPFLYYGDEIGMGDNIWLPDRDASRTPMQWTPDRNAGFSTADPGKLYLPVVQSLVYNFSLVNVESQLAQSRSLLHWVRNVIHVRKAHPTFGLGSIRVLETNHESVLAFIREYEGSGNQFGDAPERILCVFSFSHNPVSVVVDVGRPRGRRGVRPVRRRRVPVDRRRRQADAHAGDAELLLAPHRRNPVPAHTSLTRHARCRAHGLRWSA